jgi:hypothetical protein
MQTTTDCGFGRCATMRLVGQKGQDEDRSGLP